jgi:hypothetical protein
MFVVNRFAYRPIGIFKLNLTIGVAPKPRTAPTASPAIAGAPNPTIAPPSKPANGATANPTVGRNPMITSSNIDRGDGLLAGGLGEQSESVNVMMAFH